MPHLKLTTKPLETLPVRSEYGERVPPKKGASKYHKGIDIAGVEGVSEVRAAHSGTIIRAGWSNTLGNFVTIQDDISKEATAYHHLYDKRFGDIYKNHGQVSISSGEVIGLVGNTGSASAGAHLHFEIYPESLANTVKNSGKGLYKFGKLINPDYIGTATGDAPRLNPRSYLADLAIDIAKSQMTGDQAYLATKADSDLTDSERTEIYLASCDIFNCDLETKLQPEAIELTGDKRDNKIYTNSQSNKLSGAEGQDTYILPDLKPRTAVDYKASGKDVISDIDKDGILQLGGVSVKATMNNVVDETGKKVDGAFAFLHNGISYYASRIDKYNKPSDTGSDLMIVPYGAPDDKDSIRIENFDFVKGGFGLSFNQETLSEFQVNTETRGPQSNHRTATLADGNFVVIWESRILGWSDPSITINGQLFDRFGTKIDEEFFIDNGTQIKEISDLCPLSNGKFVVSYSVNSAGSDRRNNYARIFNANGTASGDIFQINFDSYDRQFYPIIAPLTNNRLMFAYYGYGRQGVGNYHQIFSQSGTRIGGETYITNSVSQRFNDLRALSNGKSVMAFYNGGQAAGDNNIYIQMFDSDGSTIGDYIQASQTSSNQLQNPQIAALSHGKFAVSWEGIDNRNISVQIFNDEGIKIGDEISLISPEGENQILSDVSSISEDRFIVSCYKYPNDNWQLADEHLQIIDQNGTLIGSQLRLNNQTSGTQYFSSISPLADNRFVAIWEDSDRDGSDYGLFGNIFDQDGQVSSRSQTVQLSSTPVISEIAEIIDVSSETEITSSQGGSNVFTFTNTDPNRYVINNFKFLTAGRRRLLDNSAYIDQLDFAALNSNDEFDEGDNETIILDPIRIIATQQDEDIRIYLDDYDLEVILTNSKISQLSEINFIGDVDLRHSYFTVNNLHQQLDFDQLQSDIILQNMVIHPFNPDDEFEINITLKDSENNIIIDEDELTIQTGITEDETTESTFKNGVWKAKGNASEVNDLLQNLVIEIGEEFAEDFIIDVTIKDLTHNVTKNNSSNINYECAALPLELQEIIEAQHSQSGKNLVMNLIRYFKDPNDPQYEKAIFNLSANINQAIIDGSLDIKKINSSTFEISGNHSGIFELTAKMQGQCHQLINQTFALNISDPDLPHPMPQQSSNNTALIIGLLSGGGALLLTAGLCTLYKNSDKVKSFCSKLLSKTVINDDEKELNQPKENKDQTKPKSEMELFSSRQLNSNHNNEIVVIHSH